MDTERWRRLDALFLRALDQPESERLEFLRTSCPDDSELRREVAAMLAADAADSNPDIAATRLGGIVRSELERLADDSDLFAAENDGEVLPFQTLGPYRLIEELGRGGLSTVYRAERDDEEFAMEVAVKLVRRGLDSPRLLERLRLERQILARLEHPNIARLIDGGTAPDGRPYFVMERIEGERIDHWCHRQRLDLRRRVELFLQVCDAVQAAHHRLVLHRDIKPSNILVTREGVPKLLDFGIAKLLDPPEDEAGPLAAGFSTLTDTGMRLLTPEFASPEQVRGEALTTASDVYSLGVLLYHLVAGEAPYTFDRRRPAEIEKVVCETEPLRPSAVVWARENDDTDAPTRRSLGWPARASGDELDLIVQEALRKEPERRYGPVARLADDLRCYLADLPISARPDTLSYRAGKFVRRHRGAVISAVLLVSVLLGGVITTAWQARVARRAQQVAEEQRAMAEAQKEQAERERRRAEEATRFLVDLFGISDPLRTEGERQQTTARELLDRGAERMGERLGDDPLLRATLMTTIGQVYTNLGLLDESDVLLREALELRRGALGEDADEVLDNRQALADLRIDQERFHEAEEILEEVVAVRRERDDASALAEALEDLAVVRRALDRVPEAEALLEEALELQATIRDPLATAQIQNTLGRLRRGRGDYETAEAMLREVLEVREKRLGKDHPLVMLTLNDLALTLQDAGDFEVAEALYREVLAGYRRIFGERHHHVVSAIHNLASTLVFQREVAEALRLYDQNEALVLDLYGADHPAMARVYYSRGLAYRVAGRPADAIPWIREAREIHVAHYGVDHTSALRDANQLAELLAQTGDPGAEDFLRELIADLRRVLEPGDWRLSYPIFRLGVLRLAEGDLEEAESLLREAVSIRRSILPAGHWETAQAEGQLGRCLVRLGRFDEAEALLRASYAALSGQYDEEQEQVRTVKRYLDELAEARARASAGPVTQEDTVGSPSRPGSPSPAASRSTSRSP